MVDIALIRPGSTSFDEEGRIKGSLDIPLSPDGEKQSAQVAIDFAKHVAALVPKRKLITVYSGPCQSAQATAAIVAEHCESKSRIVSSLQNLDHGLWQGKLIDEVKRLQPTLYRQIRDSSESFSPPGGETVEEALARVRHSISKLLKKHRNDLIALVVPDPLLSIVRHLLTAGPINDLWKAERDCCSWELLHVESHQLTLV